MSDVTARIVRPVGEVWKSDWSCSCGALRRNGGAYRWYHRLGMICTCATTGCASVRSPEACSGLARASSRSRSSSWWRACSAHTSTSHAIGKSR